MRVVKLNLGQPIVPCVVLLFHRVNALPGVESTSDPYGPGTNFNQSMAVVIVFLMCAFFFMALFSIYIRECLESGTANRNTGPATTDNRSRNHGLERAAIETFPILVYSAVKELKIGKGALECAVCLNEFEDYETLRLLPKCDHVFHPDCIDAWLASHVTCPVCRAMLTVTPDELAREATQSTGSSNRSTQEDATSELGEVQNDHVLIDVNDDQSTLEIGNRPARTTVSGKFPRSHSTGHSLVQTGENTERYTLRLPEEVRKQILESTGKLRRSSSYDVVLGRVWSSRKGYRGGGDWEWEGSSRGKRSSVDRQVVGRSDWWVFSMTPPFVSKGGSVKSPKLGVAGEGNVTNGKSFLASVKMPLDCL